jgi:hypothetical protein
MGDDENKTNDNQDEGFDTVKPSLKMFFHKDSKGHDDETKLEK